MTKSPMKIDRVVRKARELLEKTGAVPSTRQLARALQTTPWMVSKALGHKPSQKKPRTAAEVNARDYAT